MRRICVCDISDRDWRGLSSRAKEKVQSPKVGEVPIVFLKRKSQNPDDYLGKTVEAEPGVDIELAQNLGFGLRRIIELYRSELLLFIHLSDIPGGELDRVLQTIGSAGSEAVVYSTAPAQVENQRRRAESRGVLATDGVCRARVVWYEGSVPHSRNPVDEFAAAVSLWMEGCTIDSAFAKAREATGVDYRDRLIAFRLLLDCSILLVTPQHGAFPQVSEEVRQIAARSRDDSFWASYWSPVKEFLTASLTSSPNMVALGLPESEKNALAECLRYVAEMLSGGDGRPDPDAQCIKKYLAERFSA